MLQMAVVVTQPVTLYGHPHPLLDLDLIQASRAFAKGERGIDGAGLQAREMQRLQQRRSNDELDGLYGFHCVLLAPAPFEAAAGDLSWSTPGNSKSNERVCRSSSPGKKTPYRASALFVMDTPVRSQTALGATGVSARAQTLAQARAQAFRDNARAAGGMHRRHRRSVAKPFPLGCGRPPIPKKRAGGFPGKKVFSPSRLYGHTALCEPRKASACVPNACSNVCANACAGPRTSVLAGRTPVSALAGTVGASIAPCARRSSSVG